MSWSLYGELPAILTCKEVAHYLRVSEKTVQRLCRMGRLKAIPMAGALRFKREAVLDFTDPPRGPRP